MRKFIVFILAGLFLISCNNQDKEDLSRKWDFSNIEIDFSGLRLPFDVDDDVHIFTIDELDTVLFEFYYSFPEIMASESQVLGMTFLGKSSDSEVTFINLESVDKQKYGQNLLEGCPEGWSFLAVCDRREVFSAKMKELLLNDLGGPGIKVQWQMTETPSEIRICYRE